MASGTTPSKTQTPQVGRIFFLRPPEEPWTVNTNYEEQLTRGDLWMAGADGSREQQISFGKANVAFAGFLMTESGPTVYYTSGEGTGFDLLEGFGLGYSQDVEPTAHHLWRKDLETGVEIEVLSFTGLPRQAMAAVSPDGQSVALADGRDITLVDLATGERRKLFESNHPGCEEIDVVSCFSYNQPHWSPDGSLLAVGRSGWEWWGQSIVDPFSQPPASGPFTDVPYVQGELDWKTSDEACATVFWDGPSGLYLIYGPDWAFDPHEAEDITGYCPDPAEQCHRDVGQCGWLDGRRIAFWSGSSFSSSSTTPRIEVIDVDTQEITTLAEFPFESHFIRTPNVDMFVLRDEGLIVYNWYHDILHEEEGWETFTTPGLLQVADGSQQPILRERDYVVAVVPGVRGK